MKLFISVVIASGLAVSAHAQNAGEAASLRMSEVAQSQARFNESMRSSALERQSRDYRDTANPRRIRRAEEAAALINAGNCTGAHSLATRANDRNLAIRVEQACNQVGTPIPAEQRVPVTD